MCPFSDSYANNVLSFIFAKTSTLTAPAQVYIGLCSNDPEADGGTITELSGNGYARVLVSQKGEAYPNVIGSAANRVIKNQYQINWSKATGAWATAKGYFLADAATGGNIMYYATLDAPVTCAAGAVMLFDPQTLEIKFPTADSAAAAAVVDE